MAAQRCTVQRLDDVDLTFNGRFHIHRELNRASRFLSRSGKPSGTQLLTACAGGATAVVFEAMDMKNSHLVALKARDAAARARSRQMRRRLRRCARGANNCPVAHRAFPQPLRGPARCLDCIWLRGERNGRARGRRARPSARRHLGSLTFCFALQVLNNNLHASEHTGMEVSLEAAEREVASARQLKHPNSASTRQAHVLRCAALPCCVVAR